MRRLAAIAKCLDHAASTDQIVPSVTGKVYVHSPRMREKGDVLDRIAAEPRRIIGERAPVKQSKTGLRLAT